MCILGPDLAAEANEASAEGKVSRLGFVFDPQVRASALASAKKNENATSGDGAVPAGVVRLPRYVVTEQLLRLKPEELLTPDGRLETAKKRYLNRGYQKTLGQLAAVAGLLANPLGGWAPNAPEAMALYADDEQKRRDGEMSDLNELVSLHRELSAPAPKKAKK